jgi:hypothetical protein
MLAMSIEVNKMNNKEIKNQNNNNEQDNEFNQMFGLWPGRGKVAFSTYIKDEVTIPAGAKVLVFRVEDVTPENNKPTLRLVWTRD